jgi:type IV pilus assembly protein PilE
MRDPMKIHRRAGGFTLIELMVTIVIGAILIAIAGPAYLTQIRKSRRTEAKTAILDLASREERLYSTTNTYSADPATLGYPAFGQPIGGGYYKVDVAAPAAANPATYQITATAINSQLKDTACATFVVDQTGKQRTTNSAGTDSSAQCLN